MKAKELVKLFEGKEEYEVGFVVMDCLPNTLPLFRSFSIEGIQDIGYGDKTIQLLVEER